MDVVSRFVKCFCVQESVKAALWKLQCKRSNPYYVVDMLNISAYRETISYCSIKGLISKPFPIWYKHVRFMTN